MIGNVEAINDADSIRPDFGQASFELLLQLLDVRVFYIRKLRR